MSIQSILALTPRVGSPKVRFIVADRAAPGFRRVTMNDSAFDKAISTNDRVAAQADLMAQARPLLPPGAQMSTYYTDAQKVQHTAFSINIPLDGNNAAAPMMDVNAQLAAAAGRYLTLGGDPSVLKEYPASAIGLALIEAAISTLKASAGDGATQAPAQAEDVPF